MAIETKNLKIAMVPKGEWASSITYNYLDIVIYNGNSYVAIKSGSNKNPETQSTYWQLLAQKGSKGDKGDNGTNGTNGIDGANGKDGTNGRDGINGKDGVDGKDGDPAPVELIAPAVDTWLSQNFSDPANPPLDASLTSANSAAQAKATGKKIKDVLDIFALPFNETKSYKPYEHVLHENTSGVMCLWRCKSSLEPGSWNQGDWQQFRVGNIHQRLRETINDYKVFNQAEEYKVGDYIFYNNVLERCIKNTSINKSHQASQWQVTPVTNELPVINEENTGVFLKGRANLDTVAYNGKTYRQIFITENLSPWKGFDNNETINIYAGSPEISNSDMLHQKNLQCFGETAQQLRTGQLDFSNLAGHILFLGVNVNCKRYVSGGLGIQISGGGQTYIARISSKTNGWISIINWFTLPTDLSSYTNFRFYGGSFSLTSVGNLDGYIDDTVLIDLTDIFDAGKEPDKDTCERLFSEYNSILSNNFQYAVSGYNNFNPNQSYWAFIDAENKKAKEIGMLNTETNTPSGSLTTREDYAPKIQKNGILDDNIEASSTSTALDLLKLTTIATSYNELCKVWNRPKQTITVIRAGKKVEIELESTVTGTNASNYFGLPFGQPENFSTEKTYSIRDYAMYQDTLYYCVGSTGPGQWDSSKWRSPFNDHYYVLGGKTGHWGSALNLLMCACNSQGETLVGVIGYATSELNRFLAMRQLFKIGFDKLHNIENTSTVTAATYAVVWELPKFNSAMCSNGYWPTPLYEQNVNTEFTTASVIKTLTVITALDYITDLEDTYIIQESDTYVGGSGNVFQAGDIVKIRDLLYAIMLPSSNHAATALAHYVGNLILQKDLQNKKGIINNLPVYRIDSME